MHVILERFAHSPLHGTFGILTVDGESFYTVEQDWENNEPFKSCIPNGEYKLLPHDSPKYGSCFIIENEALNVSKYKKDGVKRYGCLIHPANKASQLQGCVAPGVSIGMLDNELAVLGSRKAFNIIKTLLNSDEIHTLIITAQFPTFTEE